MFLVEILPILCPHWPAMERYSLFDGKENREMENVKRDTPELRWTNIVLPEKIHAKTSKGYHLKYTLKSQLFANSPMRLFNHFHRLSQIHFYLLNNK